MSAQTFICPSGTEDRKQETKTEYRGQGRGAGIFVLEWDKELALNREKTAWTIEKWRFIKVKGATPG